MRLKQLAYVASIAVVALGLAACGGSSKKSSSTGTTSTQSSASARAEAKAALAKWLALTPKVNAAFGKYGSSEPAHARTHDVLAVRRDAYDLRNAVYRFDIGVRKVKFPTTMQTEVNSLLDTTKAIVAALDGVSQTSKVATIDRNVAKANAQLKPLDERTHAINVDLHRLAGQPLPTSTPAGGGGSEVAKVAAGLRKDPAKTGVKGQADATCAAKLLVKTAKKPDLDKIAAGEIPSSGPLATEVGAALLTCNAAAG